MKMHNLFLILILLTFSCTKSTLKKTDASYLLYKYNQDQYVLIDFLIYTAVSKKNCTKFKSLGKLNSYIVKNDLIKRITPILNYGTIPIKEGVFVICDFRGEFKVFDDDFLNSKSGNLFIKKLKGLEKDDSLSIFGTDFIQK